MPWWSSVEAIARRLDMAYDEAVELARACADVGFVTRGRAQLSKPDRRGAAKLHVVTLNQAGRELVRGKGEMATPDSLRERRNRDVGFKPVHLADQRRRPD